MTPFEKTPQIDSLLDANLTDYLDRRQVSMDTVHDFSASVSDIFTKKIADLGSADNTANQVRKKLYTKLHSINSKLEETHGWGSLTSEANLERASQELFTLSHQDTVTGYYLKEKVAIELLTQNPPRQLLGHVKVGTLADLLKKMDIFHITSLTRHSESDDWQQEYKAQLAALDAIAFEERAMRTYAINSKQYDSLFENSGNHQKPWFISHNKEVGVVTCFTHHEHANLPAPTLMFVAVFLHYLFETAYAGMFNKLAVQSDPHEAGARFVSSISSGNHKLPFFNPHVYAESLYWEKGFELLHSLYPFEEMGFFKQTSNVGGFVRQEIVSLNLADLIWDVNFFHNPHVTKYFKAEPTSHFLYHFRELYWYNLFRTLIKESGAQYANEIVASNDLGDRVFTEKKLANITQ